MSRMTWNAPERRFFETGLDRGVLYPKTTVPLAIPDSINLITNPEFGNGVVGWTNSSFGTFESLDVGSEQVGSYTKGASAGADWVNSELIPVHPTLSAHASVELQPRVQGSDYEVVLAWYSGTEFVSDTSVIVANVNLPGDSYTPIAISADPPVGVTHLSLQVVPLTQLDEGAGFRFKHPIVAFGETPVAYFSGETLDTKVTRYDWAGVPHQSVSERRPVLTTAVPWEGLTSVEESGGEGAKAYFVDGRPFLYLPVPKEYKATLSAYTYPDEFSAIMGLAEVADGMYLDSQPSQAFDLCYRTLVGNGTQGVDHGYKIHLVYNATVTPASMSYETVSNSINPSTLSWEIQAVPVRVEGFRPTAHIVIDTRHMTLKKVQALEEMLYGGESDVAHMPPPQSVFDLLNYGDMIIVTDNGDGTFEVEGSYENVYMISDGEFRVDNVDGQDNGDGTFTISTTEG